MMDTIARRGMPAAFALSAILAGPAFAQDAGTLSLAPGIVVDSNRELAFAVAPAGHAQAVVLADGRTLWSSSEPMLPLAIVDGRLLALSSTRQPGLGMLLIVDPASGNALDRVAFDLPETVSAEFIPGPNRSFTAQIADAGDGVRLHWRHESWPLRGAVVLDEDGGTDPRQVESGAIDISFGGDRAYATPLREAVAPPASASPAATSEEHLQGIPGVQYAAVDRAAILASVALEDPAAGYRWTIHDRRSGRALGALESSYALAPFVVNGERLVYRAEAEGRLQADGSWINLETRVVGHDLRTGRPLWSLAVHPMVFRGPMPP